MPTPERDSQPRTQPPPAPSMKDLLASCAAATAVSTPPVEPAGEEAEELESRRDAA
ncbi:MULTISPECIES: hypothetical protein [unclassified Streptomyces]|uniref:hypothetical protein n=1 Tax=unclassified Streptomyces TaxID=2593676 RepID=UPI00331F0D21